MRRNQAATDVSVALERYCSASRYSSSLSDMTFSAHGPRRSHERRVQQKSLVQVVTVGLRLPARPGCLRRRRRPPVTIHRHPDATGTNMDCHRSLPLGVKGMQPAFQISSTSLTHLSHVDSDPFLYVPPPVSASPGSAQRSQ